MAWHRSSARLPRNLETATFVVTSINGFLFDYTHTRGLGTDRISSEREELESALYTCLSTRHLRSVRVEVFGSEADDTAAEWFDITFEWVSPDDWDSTEKQGAPENFGQYREELMSQLQALDTLPSTVDYRILLGISENDLGQPFPSIEGWVETTPRSEPSTEDIDADRQRDLTWLEYLR